MRNLAIAIASLFLLLGVGKCNESQCDKLRELYLSSCKENPFTTECKAIAVAIANGCPIPEPTPPVTTTTTTSTTSTTTTTTTLIPAPVPNCIIPDSEDPLWKITPGSGTMQAFIINAETVVGNRCGQDPVTTLHLLAHELVGLNLCAGFWSTDAIVIKNLSGVWEHYHPVSFGNGCYTGNPYKDSWTYSGVIPSPPPMPTPIPNKCPVSVSGDYFIDLRISSIGGNPLLYTATAYYCGFPLRNDVFQKCGTKCCALGVDGGSDVAVACEDLLSGSPTWNGTDTLNITSPLNGNPYNARVNSGHGVLTACGKSSCSNGMVF